MIDFSSMTKKQLKMFGAEQFKKITGQHCKLAGVVPQECSRNRFWFRVGSLYFDAVQSACGIIRTTLTDSSGFDLTDI